MSALSIIVLVVLCGSCAHGFDWHPEDAAVGVAFSDNPDQLTKGYLLQDGTKFRLFPETGRDDFDPISVNLNTIDLELAQSLLSKPLIINAKPEGEQEIIAATGLATNLVLFLGKVAVIALDVYFYDGIYGRHTVTLLEFRNNLARVWIPPTDLDLKPWYAAKVSFVQNGSHYRTQGTMFPHDQKGLAGPTIPLVFEHKVWFQQLKERRRRYSVSRIDYSEFLQALSLTQFSDLLSRSGTVIKPASDSNGLSLYARVNFDTQQTHLGVFGKSSSGSKIGVLTRNVMGTKDCRWILQRSKPRKPPSE